MLERLCLGGARCHAFRVEQRRQLHWLGKHTLILWQGAGNEALGWRASEVHVGPPSPESLTWSVPCARRHCARKIGLWPSFDRSARGDGEKPDYHRRHSHRLSQPYLEFFSWPLWGSFSHADANTDDGLRFRHANGQIPVRPARRHHTTGHLEATRKPQLTAHMHSPQLLVCPPPSPLTPPFQPLPSPPPSNHARATPSVLIVGLRLRARAALAAAARVGPALPTDRVR